MLPRPAWLALGVAATAAATQFIGCVAAAAVALAAVAAALCCEAAGRRHWTERLAIVAVGAGLLAARAALGGAGSGEVAGGAGGTAPLPEGSGPWQARVVAVHSSGGQQIATLAVDLGAGGGATPATPAPGATPATPVLTCAANFPPYPPLVAGDTINWSGRFGPLADTDYDRWLEAQGIAARCEVETAGLAAHDDSPAGRLERLRQSAGDALEKVLPEPGGGLAAAILIGLRDRVDRDVAADFTTAGVSHIVAISGWNIAIVAATVAAFVRGALTRRGRTTVTMAAIVVYTLFAGASPSVVRAAVMAAAALLTLESGRGARVSVGLAWAVTAMLLVQPATIADPGFQLSAAATAGLVAWGTPLTERIARAVPKLPGAIRETLGVSLAAQAATLPIALLDFGRLAPIAPVANLVAVPLVPPAMAAGALAFGAGLLGLGGAPPWLTGFLAIPAWALLSLLIAVVHLAATTPGANVTLLFPANALAAGASVLLLACLHSKLGARGRRRRPMARPASSRAQARPGGKSSGKSSARPNPRWWLGLAGVVAISAVVVAARPGGAVHVIVLDVGQGDAILIEGDRGSRMLVDGGPDGGTLVRALDSFVPAWDRDLDAVVLTHPHEDHVGGLATVLRRYTVRRAFESGWPAESPGYLAFSAAVSQDGLTLERLRTGDAIRLDDCLLRVLWPDDGAARRPDLDPQATDNRQTNDSSIVLLGEFGGRRFLLTGDAEDDIDPILLARGLPAVDVLKVPHHGSATATSDALLEATRPAVAIVSVGAGNSYGHPAPSTMARLRSSSREVLRTDQVGSVEVTLDAAGVGVTYGRRAAAAAIRPGAGAGVAVALRGLLYDSIDVRSEPSRKRLTAVIARPTAVAPVPLEGRGGDCRLVGAACGVAWPFGRSPPRRIRGPAPRHRQAGVDPGPARRAAPRRRFGPLAGGSGSSRARRRDRRAPRDSSGRRRMVRPLARLGHARNFDRVVRGQARRSTARADGQAIRPLGAALSPCGAGRPDARRLVAGHGRRGAR